MECIEVEGRATGSNSSAITSNHSRSSTTTATAAATAAATTATTATPPPPPPLPSLPAGWQKAVDEHGVAYFFNQSLGRSQWAFPAFDDEPPRKKVCLHNQAWLNLSQIPLMKPIGPPFVTQELWLDTLVGAVADLSLQKDAPDGSYRVPITSLARCSRGGKTRALLELARGLWESKKIPTLFVTFNDFSDCDEEVKRGDSCLDMLCRRIAFAARPQSYRSSSIAKDFDTFKKYSIPESNVKTWLGDNPVILLIDELNQVELDGEVVSFLKKNFCQGEGRYFVFSSHLSSTNPEHATPSSSYRDMHVAGLPLIQNLSEAREKLNIEELTPRLALYYGLIPALLVTSLTVEGLADVRQVDNRVQKACGGMHMGLALLQNVMYSFFTGEAMNSNLDVLLDSSNSGNYWIPCYLMRLLKRLGTEIGGRFGLGLRDIAVDTEGWSICKEGSGDGWESLFLLVLWLRFASGRTDDIDCIPSIVMIAEEVTTHLFYNYPFPSKMSIATIQNVQQLQEALDMLQETYEWNGSFPKVSIYYPKLANFAQYDVFVCLWGKEGSTSTVTYKLYGYQLKEGKNIPNKDAPLLNSYLVRGNPAFSLSTRRGWTCVAKPTLQAFFGVSGERWFCLRSG